MHVLLVDALPMRVLGLFDHLGLSYSRQLNGPGSASITVPIQEWRENLDRDLGVGRTFVYIVDEHVPGTGVEWWGILWDAQLNLEARTVGLAAAGIQTVLERRTLREDLYYAGQDQAAIALDLILRAQAGEQRDLHITTPSQPTGVMRDRTYLGVERKRFGELLANLSAVINGFDYEFEAQWAGGGNSPTHTALIHFPAPRDIPVNTIVARGNVTIQNMTVTATNLLSSVDGIGAEELRVTETLLIPGYPALDGAVNHTSVTQAPTLTEHAQRALQANHAPKAALQLIVLVPAGQPMPVTTGQVVRVIDVDDQLDRTMVCTDLSVQLSGAGRSVTVGLVEPTNLARTDEAGGP